MNAFEVTILCFLYNIQIDTLSRPPAYSFSFRCIWILTDAFDTMFATRLHFNIQLDVLRTFLRKTPERMLKLSGTANVMIKKCSHILCTVCLWQCACARYARDRSLCEGLIVHATLMFQLLSPKFRSLNTRITEAAVVSLIASKARFWVQAPTEICLVWSSGEK